jgi:hypothetical protein
MLVHRGRCRRTVSGIVIPKSKGPRTVLIVVGKRKPVDSVAMHSDIFTDVEFGVIGEREDRP